MGPCPRCSENLRDVEELGEPLRACARCGGRWLTAESLGALVSARVEAEGEVPEEAHLQVPLAEVREELTCPDCGRVMEAFNYAADSGVILDRCGHCGGVWVDGGELERAARAVAASRSGLQRDAKLFSADLHREEVRQDALEQRDARAGPFPGGKD